MFKMIMLYKVEYIMFIMQVRHVFKMDHVIEG